MDNSEVSYFFLFFPTPQSLCDSFPFTRHNAVDRQIKKYIMRGDLIFEENKSWDQKIRIIIVFLIME